MLCIKLGAIVQCRDMLEDVVRDHVFEDGMEHPMTNSLNVAVPSASN